MISLKLAPKNSLNKQVKAVAAILKNNGVMAYPTDTVYGLGCLATDTGAIKKIQKLKWRGANKAMIILVSSVKMLERYCLINTAQKKILRMIWPGPFSIILSSKLGLPRQLTGGEPTLAARLPKNDFLIKLIKHLDCPLVSTSLNISGQEVLTSVNNLDKYFKTGLIDLVVDGGPMKKRAPSKLLDLRDVDCIKIIR